MMSLLQQLLSNIFQSINVKTLSPTLVKITYNRAQTPAMAMRARIRNNHYR
jgi:hypothetical protein